MSTGRDEHPQQLVPVEEREAPQLRRLAASTSAPAASATHGISNRTPTDDLGARSGSAAAGGRSSGRCVGGRRRHAISSGRRAVTPVTCLRTLVPDCGAAPVVARRAPALCTPTRRVAGCSSDVRAHRHARRAHRAHRRAGRPHRAAGRRVAAAVRPRLRRPAAVGAGRAAGGRGRQRAGVPVRRAVPPDDRADRLPARPGRRRAARRRGSPPLRIALRRGPHLPRGRPGLGRRPADPARGHPGAATTAR